MGLHSVFARKRCPRRSCAAIAIWLLQEPVVVVASSASGADSSASKKNEERLADTQDVPNKVLLGRGLVGVCRELADPHGVWSGSRKKGGVYTLECNNGFGVPRAHGNTTKHVKEMNLTCPASLAWAEEPKCENMDDCKSLKNGCGSQGICVDQVDGYQCNCQKGVPLVLADDDSGEWVCQPPASSNSLCEGADCSAHGVCVDLAISDEEFDTGNHTGYKCACQSGYFDNGETCLPNDCGTLKDPFGTWEGDPSFGEDYTLRCGRGSFIQDGLHKFLRETTVQCPEDGSWPVWVPHCVNAWQEAEDATLNSFRFYFSVASATLCVVCAALAAGLTMGLVSLEPFDLHLTLAMKEEDVASVEEQQRLQGDKEAAQQLLPLKQDHHLLLVTLLLMNSLANEALPIFLDQLVPSWMAVLLSVSCVLFFGEILPSAVFTGPKQLAYAACFAPLVRMLTVLAWPIAKPIAKVLDSVIGAHHDSGQKYDIGQLKAILKLHETCPGTEMTLEKGSSRSLNVSPSIRRESPYLSLLASEDAVQQEGGLQPAGSQDGHGGQHVLAPTACRMAQQCLKISTMLIEDLRPELQAIVPPNGGGLASTARQTPEEENFRISPDMTVLQAIEAMRDLAPGARVPVLGMQSTVSLDELVRAALLPRLDPAVFE